MAATVDTGSLSAWATGSGTSIVVDAPTGVAEGDLVVVALAAETGVDITGLPTGFSELLAMDEYGSIVGGLYGKVATASEGSTYTFTASSSSTAYAARSFIVDGADLSNFPTSTVVATSTNEAATGDNTVAGITLASAGDLLLAHVFTRFTSSTVTSSEGMTALWAAQALGSRITRSFYESPGAGATGTRTFSDLGSTSSKAGLLGIAAAAGDTQEPTLSSPSASATGSTTGSGSVSTDEGNGTLYWVVTTSATAPSVAQVQAGQDHTGSAAADSGSQAVSGTGSQSISGGFTGLTESTTYYAHYQHQDAATNDSTVASSSSFTTSASPVFGRTRYRYTGAP